MMGSNRYRDDTIEKSLQDRARATREHYVVLPCSLSTVVVDGIAIHYF